MRQSALRAWAQQVWRAAFAKDPCPACVWCRLGGTWLPASGQGCRSQRRQPGGYKSAAGGRAPPRRPAAAALCGVGTSALAAAAPASRSARCIPADAARRPRHTVVAAAAAAAAGAAPAVAVGSPSIATAIAVVIGWLVIAGSCVRSLPQILRILKNRRWGQAGSRLWRDAQSKPPGCLQPSPPLPRLALSCRPLPPTPTLPPLLARHLPPLPQRQRPVPHLLLF